MAHAFKKISAKPTFGKLNSELYQSDYINQKKGLIVFCKLRCQRNKIASSYDSINNYNIGRNTILNRCNLLRNNKANLIISQYTKENLNNVCTVSPIAPYIAPTPCSNDVPCNPCQNNDAVIIDPSNSVNTFYNEYYIDPLGELFGKTQCGELNYTDYMVANVNVS